MSRMKAAGTTVAVCVGAAALVSAGFGIGNAVGSAKAVTACVTTKNVVVGATKKGKCPSGSHKLKVATVGPRGEQGPPGLPGTTAFGTDTGNSSGGPFSDNCVLGDVWVSAIPGWGPGTPANGQIWPINGDTAALYSLIGTTYGGNGTTTFQLPDLRASTPNGMTTYICTEGIFPART